MASFIVVRHGSNAANQSRRNRMVLGTVAGSDRDDAKQIAAEKFNCYNNQHLELIDLAGRTKNADREEAAEMDALALAEANS